MADKLYSGLGVRAAVLTTDILAFLPVAGPPAEQADVAKLIVLLNTIYAPITGGAYVLKAGDTMTGPLLASPDNTVDLGASGATRFRTGYFGTSVVTALLTSPAATALQFSQGGTAIAMFDTLGHMTWNTDNTYDIGDTNNRPRDLWIGRNGMFSGSLAANGLSSGTGDIQVADTRAVYWSTRSAFKSPANAVITLLNNAESDFGRLQFGGTAATFPSIKRSAALLQARLADDSTFTEIECSNIISNNASAAFSTNTTLTNFAAAALGTLTNAPTAGNAAKWCAFDDNGTTRYFPTWI